MTDMRYVINRYYEYRKYVMPDVHESFLWMVSEVGELAEALMNGVKREHPLFMKLIMRIGQEAEKIAEKSPKNWTRNRGRITSKDDLRGEIADVYIMLDRVAHNLNLPSPEVLAMQKMESKGFKIGEMEIASALQENHRLRTRIAVLSSALKPFAEAGALLDQENSEVTLNFGEDELRAAYGVYDAKDEAA